MSHKLSWVAAALTGEQAHTPQRVTRCARSVFWLQQLLLSPRLPASGPPGTFDKPKAAGNVQATEAPQVSPHEIMVKQGRILPVEYWDAF
jgi:hypothetical protein